MIDTDFLETNFHPPSIFDSPVLTHRHSHQALTGTQQIAHEKTISNDGRGSNISNNHDEFAFRRKLSHEIPPIFPTTSLIRMDSNAISHSEEGTNHTPPPNPIYHKDAFKEKALLYYGRHHDSSSDEDGTGGDGSFDGEYSGLEDWEYHNLRHGQVHTFDYDSDYWEDERMMMKWQARRSGLLYLGVEELEKHAEKMRLSDDEKIRYLLGK